MDCIEKASSVRRVAKQLLAARRASDIGFDGLENVVIAVFVSVAARSN
jgi:hypothetical protein